jgi:hypothetical protein
LLLQESDITCKRNAFVTLTSIAQPAAVAYLLNASETVDSMDELMQMAVIELIRLDAKGDSPNRVSGWSVGYASSPLTVRQLGKVDQDCFQSPHLF